MPIEYKVRLTITYTYNRPAGGSRSLLRMLPRSLPEQQLIAGVVKCSPEPDSRRDSTDFFGNPLTELAHDTPLSEVSFQFEGRVRKVSSDDGFDFSTALDALTRDIALQHSLAPESPHHFLGPSDRIPSSPDIADFAQEVVGGGVTTLEAVQKVASAIYSEMAFDPTATDVTTTPAEAFLARSGVCQDFSHIMITALRALGIPAGYISGFLRTNPPEGQARLEGADAMHAWVRAWCGAEAGWVQIDPTNDMMAGLDHIVVAVGRDYADVAPFKGSMRASGDHSTRHEVDVVPL